MNPPEIQQQFLAEQQQVERTLREIMDAVRRKDVDRLEAFHLYGPKFTKFDDFEPLDRQDAEACRRSEREGIEAAEAAEFSFSDLKVDVFGTIAIATFVLDENLRVGGEAIKAKARSTMVFAKIENDWKIVHEHFSAFKANP